MRIIGILLRMIENWMHLKNEKIIEKLRIEFGNTKWDEFDNVTRNRVINYVSERFKYFLKKPITDSKDIYLKQPRLHEEIFKSLQEKYGVPDKNITYLWHPSEQDKYPNAEEYYEIVQGKDKKYISEKKIDRYLLSNPAAEKTGWALKLLGSPEPISKGFKNPMALKTLYRLKWLINYLLQTRQIDEDTKIVVEMARDGQLNDSNKRAAIRRWQQNREKENEKYKKKIEEINEKNRTNFTPEDKDLIKKLRLWNEQGKQCLYTGETINCCDVFNGNKYDFEHTIPQKMSFDNELKNLTLASTNYNRNIKKKRIPFQLENYVENARVEGIEYGAIKPRLKFMIKKIEKLEEDINENIRKVKYVSTKEVKDVMIQNRYMMKLDLDYWKAKYHTFTCEEYKQSWRNSQLRDTQTITKYALPYLKTIFKKVTVQTGATVNKFKEIYGVKFSDEKKDRNNHSHHATDAAILTLIPNNYYREKMLEMYHDAKEKKLSYRDVPREWDNFKSHFILNIKETVLANYLSDNRTLVPTYKKIRKRRKIKYNKKTNQPQIAKGDSIRGQLHSESFYGAIKQPKRDADQKILFDEKGKMLLEDEIKMVIRRNLVFKKDANSTGFKSLEELEKVIVDKYLFQDIKIQVDSKTFKDALEEGIWKLDKHGNKVNRIRRVRCFENKNIKYKNAIQISEHRYISKHTHKKFLLSKNAKGSVVYCLFYKDKKINPIGLFDISLHGIKSLDDISSMSHFRRNDQTPRALLYLRQHFLFFKESIDELKELTQTDLSKRLYYCYQFEKDGRIKFKHHLLAGKDEELKKQHTESSKMIFDEYAPLLRLSSKNFNFAIEGIDFEIMLDGEIRWMF